jgi:4-hydroxy-3-polyprenylbenzoate decarboxylase
MKIIVGITGASGIIMGVELLKALRNQPQCETHLVISDGAKKTLSFEGGSEVKDIVSLADHYYETKNMGAVIASGSFKTDGMVIIPCSMKTLASVVHGYADNLLTRAADVCIKENRRVVLVTREMPLSRIHLKNMLEAAESGCTLIPPMLTFYNQPKTIQDQINHLIGKILMQFGLDHEAFLPWKGNEKIYWKDQNAIQEDIDAIREDMDAIRADPYGTFLTGKGKDVEK